MCSLCRVGVGSYLLGLKEISHQPPEPNMTAGFSEHKSRGADLETQHCFPRLGIKTHNSGKKKKKGDEVRRTLLLLNEASQTKEKACFLPCTV